MIFFLNNKFILFKCHILIALNLQSQKQYLQLDNGVKVSVQVLIMGSCSGSGQTKDYKIGIFCFSVKYGALRRKSKDWLWISIMCDSVQFSPRFLWRLLRTCCSRGTSEGYTYGKQRDFLLQLLVGTFPRFVAIRFYFLSETR
jgi:hypothetical protein